LTKEFILLPPHGLPDFQPVERDIGPHTDEGGYIVRGTEGEHPHGQTAVLEGDRKRGAHKGREEIRIILRVDDSEPSGEDRAGQNDIEVFGALLLTPSLIAKSGPGNRSVQSLLTTPATPAVPMKKRLASKVTLPTVTLVAGTNPRSGNGPVALVVLVAARNAALSSNLWIVTAAWDWRWSEREDYEKEVDAFHGVAPFITSWTRGKTA
jgi:hypothetical protein